MKHRFAPSLFRRAMQGLSCLFILLLLFVPAGPVGAAKAERTVRVGCFTSSGYHQKSADGSINGYGYEYEILLAQYAGWNVVCIEGTWSQLQEMLAKGEIDLLGFLIKTPEREQLYDYASHASGASTSCLIAADAAFAYNDYAAFDGMRVGYQEKNANLSSFLAWCERNGFSAETVPYDSYEAVYHAIDTGAVDAGLATNFYDLSDYQNIANVTSADFFYAVTKGNSALLGELNAAIDNIHIYYPDIETSLYDHFYDSFNGRGESFSKEERAYLASSPTVKVFPAGRGAPYETPAREGEYTGFIPDVLAQLSQVTGLRFVYDTEQSFREYIQSPGSGDGISSMTCDPAWAKQNGVKITQPFINSTISIITRDGREDILSIAMQHENYLIAHLKAAHPDWEIQTYDSMKDRLNAVFNGKCDATIMNSYEATYHLFAGKYKLLSEVVTSDISQNIGFAVSPKSDPRLFSILSKALLMVDSDTYTALMRSNLDHAGDAGLFSLIYTNPVQVLLVLALLLLLLAVALFSFIYSASIKKKNQAILAATQVKNDFFARMSHDMRTPMNGILGMTALSKGETDLSVLHHNLDQIEYSGQYMLSLINDMLDLQKIEKDRLELAIQPVYVRDFVSRLVEMMQPTAAAKGVTFTYENINISLEKTVLLDPARITQVFTNLLSNAIKFTDAGGRVHFTTETLSSEGHVDHDRFCISDTGIGMSSAFMENGLFKPYNQEDPSSTTRYGGAGLGLAISKHIIDAMGGSITVESQKGKGTCFTVLLDFQVALSPKPQKETAGKPEHGPHWQELHGKRILLCEDHPVNAEIAKRLLAKAGCEVVHAADGRLGVEQFEASAPGFFDAVLMDIRMPNMDGLAAAKALRASAHPDAKTIPVLAMTANAYPADVQASLSAGMNAHLSKPICPEVLYQALEQHIAISGKAGKSSPRGV